MADLSLKDWALLYLAQQSRRHRRVYTYTRTHTQTSLEERIEVERRVLEWMERAKIDTCQDGTQKSGPPMISLSLSLCMGYVQHGQDGVCNRCIIEEEALHNSLAVGSHRPFLYLKKKKPKKKTKKPNFRFDSRPD